MTAAATAPTGRPDPTASIDGAAQTSIGNARSDSGPRGHTGIYATTTTAAGVIADRMPGRGITGNIIASMIPATIGGPEGITVRITLGARQTTIAGTDTAMPGGRSPIKTASVTMGKENAHLLRSTTAESGPVQRLPCSSPLGLAIGGSVADGATGTPTPNKGIVHPIPLFEGSRI